jgi:3-hydroxybutyryl-CoA dehydrogenase
MGSGIAEVAALAGVDVILREINGTEVERGRVRIRTSLDRAVERGKITEEVRHDTAQRIHFTEELERLDDRDFIIEAVVEDGDIKTELFRQLDEICPAGTVLASNTSSIPIMKLAMATDRPASVVGLHFFNPVPVMQLVEVVPSLVTSEETVIRATELASQLDKAVVRAPDRAGFIVNALLIPYLLDAIRFYEAGLASAEDIDTGMRLGANHPIGPLALADLIGNDTMLHVAESLFDEFRDSRMSPPALLRRMVDAGRLGRKSGRGFYEY